MLCNLWSSCRLSKCLVIFDNCFIVDDIYWMWVPSVDILCYELMENAFDTPMTHEILFKFNFDIRGACHNHYWFKPTCGINLIDWFLLDTITWSSFNSSLQRSFSPWVVHTDITYRLPLLLFVIKCQDISRELIHKDMKSFVKLVEHICFHSLLDSCERSTFLTTIDDRDMFWFHGAVVCNLC